MSATTPLFQPTAAGPLSLQNRIAMAPMTRSRAIGNIPNSIMRDYYAQRSGAGLIITEGTSPSPEGLGYARIPGLFNQAQADGWRDIANAVHADGARLVVQLMHTGRIGHAAQPTRRQPADRSVGRHGGRADVDRQRRHAGQRPAQGHGCRRPGPRPRRLRPCRAAGDRRRRRWHRVARGQRLPARAVPQSAQQCARRRLRRLRRESASLPARSGRCRLGGDRRRAGWRAAFAVQPVQRPCRQLRRRAGRDARPGPRAGGTKDRLPAPDRHAGRGAGKLRARGAGCLPGHPDPGRRLQSRTGRSGAGIRPWRRDRLRTPVHRQSGSA